MTWITILLAIGAMLVLISLICIRLILVPNGQFRGTCSSNNALNKREGNGNCVVCGKKPEEACPNQVESALAATTADPLIR